MTLEEEIHNAIYKELVLSYTQAGRVVPTTLAVVSKSLTESLKFSNVEEVHEAFRRARDMADIPTQRVLKEALANHRAENYSDPEADRKAIAYSDPIAAWLPKNPLLRAINVNESVKNYCIACGGNAYWRLCDAKASGKEAYNAFTHEIKATVKKLYDKYWRKCPIANGYPYNAEISLSLIPATVDDFRRMLAAEAEAYA